LPIITSFFPVFRAVETLGASASVATLFLVEVPAESVLWAAAVGVAGAQLHGTHGRETHGFSGVVVPVDGVVGLSEAGAARLLEHVRSAAEGAQDDGVGARSPLAPYEEPVALAGVPVDFVLLRVVALQLVLHRGPPCQLRLREIALDAGRSGDASSR